MSWDKRRAKGRKGVGTEDADAEVRAAKPVTNSNQLYST